jgi:hypothetical protein
LVFIAISLRYRCSPTGTQASALERRPGPKAPARRRGPFTRADAGDERHQGGHGERPDARAHGDPVHDGRNLRSEGGATLTTFSAFSLDFAVLWARGTPFPPLAYAFVSVVGSLPALFVGLWLARSVG